MSPIRVLPVRALLEVDAVRILRGESGFTLMKLLVAISMAGVILAAAGPNLESTYRVYSLRGAARELFSGLQAARTGAVTENNHYRFTVQSPSLYTVHDDDDNDGSIDGGEAVPTKDLRDNSPTVTVSASGPVDFAANGTAADAATLTLSNAYGDTMQIEVSRGGRIRIL